MNDPWWGDGDPREWTSGPWSLSVRGDELADLAHHGTVVLRSVRAVVRDRNWDTAGLIVDRMTATEATLTAHVRSIGLGSSFSGIVRVEVRGERLVVRCDLESAREFETNRTGLVVLHPPSLAGLALTVTHPDGTVDDTRFPRAISPHQPVFEISRLRWRQGGTTVDVRFDGDVFEMEDQRNWSDASFKTYSRPLGLPFPYPVAAGERVVQSVTIDVAEDATASPKDASAPPTRIDLHPGGTVPRIALGAASAPDPAPSVEPLGQEVLIELDLAGASWPAALERARSAGLPLDVRFVLDPAEPGALARGVEALRGLEVARIAAFQAVGDARHVSDAAAVDALRVEMVRAGIVAPIVGGARSHFTELNRERHRIPPGLDGLVVTVTPLFHARSTEQLVESVPMQRLIARQSVASAAGLPVHIGPVSLRPRFNDVATEPQPLPPATDLAEGYGAQFTGSDDPRQASPELAAWTVASAAALAVPGVASLAWFEEWGPRGVRTADGASLPVADAISALASLAEPAASELLWGDSPDGLVWAIGVRSPEATAVLVANLDRVSRTLEVRAAGLAEHVTLPASAFVRIDRPTQKDAL